MIRKYLADGKTAAGLYRELTEQERFVQHEIEANMKYGFDRKKKSHHKTDSTESTSESKMQSERFENDEEEAISPIENPQLNPGKIESEELEQELGARNISRPSTYRQLTLLLSCLTLLSNNMVFVEGFTNYGGAWFLIPYFVLLIFFAFPIAIFELSLAQFSSLPMFAMFQRMAPILGGIPYMIVAIRMFFSVNVVFEPKFVVFMVKAFSSVISHDFSWLDCSSYKGLRCYDPSLICNVNEVQVDGTCVRLANVTYLAEQQPFTILRYFSFREQRLISLTPLQILKETKSLNVNSNMSALVLVLLLAGFIAVRGQRTFSSLAGIIAFLPIFGMLPMTIVTYYDMGIRKKTILNFIADKNNFLKIFDWNAWLLAGRVSVKTLYIADGTLFTLGSMTDFQHNFLKDAILLALSGSLFRVLLCFAILPLFYIGNLILYPFVQEELGDDHHHNDHVRFHALDLFFTAIPSYTVHGVSRKSMMIIIGLMYLTINMATVAFQIISFEMIIGWVYTRFPRLLYHKAMNVRLCVVLATSSLILLYYNAKLHADAQEIGYDHQKSIDMFVVGFISIAILVQLGFVGFSYGFRRLFINQLTMLKQHKHSYMILNKSRFVLYILWSMFIPAVCLVSLYTVLRDRVHLYNMPLYQFAFVSMFPLYYAVRLVIRAKITGEYVNLLSQTYRWEPANVAHARQAEYDERAAGIAR